MKLLFGVCLILMGVGYAWSDATTCNCGWVNKGRIVGGKEAPKNAYPLIVALVTPSINFQFCAGTIVTPWHVITAAHCTDGRKAVEINIVVEARNIQNKHYPYSYEGKALPVAEIIQHPDFEQYADDRYLKNDVSILVLDQKIIFNQNVGPACFPTGPMDLDGETVKAIGWGRTTQGGPTAANLREVDLPIISDEECLNLMPLLARPAQTLCTLLAGKDSCQGDSGGPVIYLDPETNRYTLVGVTSFGWGCAHANAPGVYADVGVFAPFLLEHIEKSKPGEKLCTKI